MALSDEKGALLVTLARSAIEEDLGIGTLDRPDESWLEEQSATFVTLEKRNELRGCIGTIEPFRSLYQDVTDNARGAAFRDPRFPPVRVDEWSSITAEVSVLSPVEELPVSSEEELFEKLEPHTHGLVLKRGYRQATFLPSVWEQLSTPFEFVRQLKRKAGIPEDEWSNEMEVFTYVVEKFRENG